MHTYARDARAEADAAAARLSAKICVGLAQTLVNFGPPADLGGENYLIGRGYASVLVVARGRQHVARVGLPGPELRAEAREGPIAHLRARVQSRARPPPRNAAHAHGVCSCRERCLESAWISILPLRLHAAPA